ncbi:Homoserine O-acetyltransferase [Limihaloglobus sulfuriphilus]|uniref:Homoserine O-acetyltransferase n=1 Tax=Limihaloglobus sulfuriphilus TaxID=1851148 RepID=A0A1Q2MG43_9BACT|nr:homoserine O-acetyltransferase [Limihaloglobus sulfuriphilus]AQQ71277.1 Homoserine O-acetyltransferase [Limihaloglobus sulfuriphilus]
MNRQNNSVGIVETKTVRVVDAQSPLTLDCGRELSPIDVSYETYGRMNESGDNVVYICHALTGNAHVAGYNSPDDKKPGWWDDFVGPGKYIDTDKYFVVCSNFLGGCSGTTGPTSINPSNGEPYALNFPVYTIGDMVRVQKLFLEKIGVNHLLAVIGGSMGGMHALKWAIEYPDFMDAAVVVASTSRLSPQAIAFDAVGRNAILADRDFQDGKYTNDKGPERGLGIARMIGHITYLSEKGMREKFGRELRTAQDYTYDFNPEFSVETYLNHQGQSFVERFDANCYLYITKAMDYFDLGREYGSLEAAFKKIKAKLLIVSFSSDWLFTPEQSVDMVNAVVANNKSVSYCNIESPYGHDAFLLEPDTLGPLIGGFLASSFESHVSPFDPESIDYADLQESAKRVRVDYEIIEDVIEPGSRVLDAGCGNGDLLYRLSRDKNASVEGIEVRQDLVIKCISKGIPVIHKDIENGLDCYRDKSFDYGVLSQTVQTLKEPEYVFRELLRVAKRVIVSFPNFAYWKVRLSLMLKGQAPVTPELPFEWYNSPNIHFLSIKDFEQFCSKIGVVIEKKVPLRGSSPSTIKPAPNFFAPQAIYLVRKD